MSTESLVSGRFACMSRASFNHSRNGELCCSCDNRSINSRRSCGVSALTSLIILLSASVDIAVSTLPTIYHTDHDRREGPTRQYQGSGAKCQKRGAATEGRPSVLALNDIRQQFVLN